MYASGQREKTREIEEKGYYLIYVRGRNGGPRLSRAEKLFEGFLPDSSSGFSYGTTPPLPFPADSRPFSFSYTPRNARSTMSTMSSQTVRINR